MTAATTRTRALLTLPEQSRPHIDLARRRIIHDGDEDDFLSLSPQDAIVLRALLRHPGRVVERERLLHAMYSGTRDGGPEHAAKIIHVTICHLRKLIPGSIVCRAGWGYAIEGYEADGRPTLNAVVTYAAHSPPRAAV